MSYNLINLRFPKKKSSKILNHFSPDSRTEKEMIYIPVHKNENHWFFIDIFPESHKIISIDSLWGYNRSELNVVVDYFKKELTYHNKEFYPRQWRFVEHTGFQRQKTTADCGIYLLINIHWLIQDSFPDENYYDINNLRYWILSKALIVSENSSWYPKNRLPEQLAKVMKTLISSPEEKMENDDFVKILAANWNNLKIYTTILTEDNLH